MYDLKSIKDPKFLKNMSIKEMKALCSDIREFLIDNISKTGGHLGSNLGIVELSVALLYVFDQPNDKIIFDVGHQMYTYKILTGRASGFENLRQFNGLNGFADYDESAYDVWESGHSSTSISALAGFIIAKQNGEDINDCVAVIGDSSVANGEAFEALNFIATIDKNNPIIILNDNKMGISKTVGATAKIFNLMRKSCVYHGIKKVLQIILPKFITGWFHQVKRGVKATIQHENIFEDLGLDYYGPYDGNNLREVIRVLERAKESKKPCVVHVYTKKGKGYLFAENDTEGKFHGVGPFDKETGKPLKKYEEDEFSYSEFVASSINDVEVNKHVVCVTPAMIVGSRLKHLQNEHPNAIFDVGIAEEHAASMCAALALNNQKPFLFVYSTFAQRAYDQILNDISRRKLPVTICIDRAGLVSGDGSTHQGIYDVAMFTSMPHMIVCQGKTLKESKALLKYISQINYPSVIRFPKANEFALGDNVEINDMSWEVVKESDKNVIITYGTSVMRILKLVNDNNLDVCVVNARFINPIDEAYLHTLKNKHVLVYEEVVENGSLGSLISQYSMKNDLNIKLSHVAIPQGAYIPFGDVNNIRKIFRLDDDNLLKEIKELCD